MSMQQKSKNREDQHKRFVEKARELGCDDDEGRFNDRLKKIANQKPQRKSAKRPAG